MKEPTRPNSAGDSLSKGWIAVVDIVGFSLKPDPIQRDIATFLMRAVESTHLYRMYLHGHLEYAVACTGDGFVLAVAESLLENRVEQILRFAEEIQALVHAYEEALLHNLNSQGELPSPLDTSMREFKIRIGLHRGEFAFEQILGQRNAVGTGLNLAVRIAGHGDAEHILASRQFVEAYAATATLVDGQFLAYSGEAGVKHGIGLQVYAYFREVEKNVVFGNKANTKSGERQRRVDQLILAALEKCTGRITRFLNDEAKIPPSETGVRLTILAPSCEPKYLAVTQYRHLEGEPSTSSNVAYRIEGDKPEGVSAEAFVLKRPALISQLPDRHREFREYCNRLAAHGLSEEAVTHFRRPCRAFVAVPFALAVAENAWFVLTLDSIDPLFAEDSPNMQAILSELKSTTDELALLLELKQPTPRGKEVTSK